MPKLVDVIIVNRVHLAKTLGFYRFFEGARAGADAQARGRMRKRRGGCASAGGSPGGPMHKNPSFLCVFEGAVKGQGGPT